MDKSIFIFLGSTGSGKTTQASKIAEHYSLKRLTTGDIVRARIAKGDLTKEKVKKFMSGYLVYSDEINDIVSDAIKDQLLRGGVVLDGYPRTKSQLSNLDSILRQTNTKITMVICITVPKEEAKKRVLGRQRPDDSEKSFENRL